MNCRSNLALDADRAAPVGPTRFFLRRLCLLLVWPVLLLAGTEPPVTPAAALPETPGAEIAPGESEAAWRPLFVALAARGSIWGDFTENRWFPFRKKPVVLKGEMRLSPARGLSLNYREPEVRTVIADAKGLAMRDAQGRTREVPPDPRATGPVTALLPIMRFDLAGLERAFTVKGARDGGAWRLEFVPRDPVLARALGTILVWGEAATVKRMEFRRSPKQRVEIVVEGARYGVSFTPEEERRYFR
jgi:hypothetical protein